MFIDTLYFGLLYALLLMVANGSPVLAARIFGERLNYPVDAGLRWRDGSPVLGASKTWRGIVAALLMTSLFTALLGYGRWLGATIALGAMTGDLVTSFIKRRKGLAPSTKCRGWDQIPEAALPMLMVVLVYGASWLAAILAVVLFFLMDVFLSPFLSAIGIRKKPY